MPIECSQLEGQSAPLTVCPNCHAFPFEPFMRGQVWRGSHSWFGFGKPRPYCAVICRSCKEIVGYEYPAGGEIELLPIYR